MKSPHTYCQLCRQPIYEGEKYGVLVFNIEAFETSQEYPEGSIKVLNSETVNIMCLQCASKYNNENFHTLLD